MSFSLKSMLFGSKGPSNPYRPVDFKKLYGMDLEAPGAAYDYEGAQKTLMEMISDPNGAGESVLQGLLGDIDADTRSAYGSTMMDMAERGLVGEGQSSDIASNALATVNAIGAKTKSGIRSQFAMDRLNKAIGAQSSWKDLLAGMSESARGRGLQRLLGLAGAQSGAYSNAAGLSATSSGGLFQDLIKGFAGKTGGNLSDFLFDK